MIAGKYAITSTARNVSNKPLNNKVNDAFLKTQIEALCETYKYLNIQSWQIKAIISKSDLRHAVENQAVGKNLPSPDVLWYNQPYPEISCTFYVLQHLYGILMKGGFFLVFLAMSSLGPSLAPQGIK
jgi:hypothetical protein